MSDFRTAVREAWDTALDDDRVVSIPALTDDFISANALLVREHSDVLIRRAVIKEFTALARGAADATGQLSLFGFPSVIAIPAGDRSDEYDYMRTTNATFADLEAGEAVRVANVEAAQARLDAYRGALEKVRPSMEGTGLTLADVLLDDELPEAA